MHRALLLLSLLGTACSRQPPPALKTVHLTPQLVLGGAEDGPSSFADIRWFQVDSRGYLYVLEGQSQEVRVFDAAGVHVRTLGRKGAGPGEFSMANGIALGPHSQLWVYDPGNSRATIFDSAGGLQESILLRLSGYGFVWAGGVDTLGTLYDPIDIPSGDTTRPALRRVLAGGDMTDTIPIGQCTGYTAPTYTFPRGGMWVPFTQPMYQDLDPRGSTWCADPRTVEIKQYRIGDTIPRRIFSARVRPLLVSQAERDSAIAEIRAFAKEVGGGAADFGLIPQTKPVLRRVDTDTEGRVWVQIEDQAGFRALIFDSLGTLKAEAQLPFHPSRWHPTIILGRSVYAVTRDSVDIPTITRYRLD